MQRPLDPYERRAVAGAIAEHERRLHRLHVRGPWRDPVLEVLLTGESHGQKLAAVEDRLPKLRNLQ